MGELAPAVVERVHIVHGLDGWRLDVVDLAPPRPAGVVIAGHAMMVDRRTLWRRDRLTLGTVLVEAGLRVLLPELRGRGRSGPTPTEGGDWSYRDLVDDVGVYLNLARRVAPGLPVALLGHSLFGHVSLAYLGREPASTADAFVAMAVNVWGRRWDPTLFRWLRKRWTMTVAGGAARAYGYMPSRRFGFGSCDEAATYWSEVSGWVGGGRWGNGEVDYHAGLANVTCPVLYVVSDGDRLYAHPDDALRFSADLSAREVLRVGPTCPDPALAGLSPGHMEMVTDPQSEPIWRAVGAWLVERLAGVEGDARALQHPGTYARQENLPPRVRREQL